MGIDDAVEAIEAGRLVVFPTDTVYGLAADARDASAIERVYAAKGRSRDNPMAFAVADIETAERFVDPSPITRSFMETFLPGPITVLCPARSNVPELLRGGGSLVGVRIPDHPLARSFLSKAGPVTATSANRSGRPPVENLAALDPAIERTASVCLDGGPTPGGVSSVVDPADGRILRRGRGVEAVDRWLADRDPP